MSFLGFMKKGKSNSSPKDEPLDIPLPPPKMENEAGLPSFADERLEEELTLPEIPDFESADAEQKGFEPGIPSFPMPERAETTEEPAPIPKMESSELEIPEMPKQMPPPEAEAPRHENAYDHTPARPKGKLFPEPHHDAPRIRGEVFIRGDDYRKLLEGLESLTGKENENITKQEKTPTRNEDKEYDRFEAMIEDMQRSLVVAEKTLFE